MKDIHSLWPTADWFFLFPSLHWNYFPWCLTFPCTLSSLLSNPPSVFGFHPPWSLWDTNMVLSYLNFPAFGFLLASSFFGILFSRAFLRGPFPYLFSLSFLGSSLSIYDFCYLQLPPLSPVLGPDFLTFFRFLPIAQWMSLLFPLPPKLKTLNVSSVIFSVS